MRARLIAACIVVATSSLVAKRAAADVSPEDQALATTLFKEARALLEAGKVSEACPKLVESQRLYPAGGTLLNLAVCHERDGKTATAWAEFREARLIAERDGRSDRLDLVDEHMKTLEPKLSKLVITVPSTADVADVEVRADEREVRRAAWGTAIPVDPGDHVIEAVAPGKKRWRTQVTVLPDADVKSVIVPDWEDEVGPAPPPVTPPPVTPPGALRPAPPDRTAALVVGGVGVASLAFGSYFGLRAIAKHNDSQDACTTNPCSRASLDLSDSAKTFADVSTVTFAVGLAAIGVGVYLWLSNHEQRPLPAALAPGRGTLDLSARF